MLEVRLLGQFEVSQDGTAIEISGRPAQALLAFLLLNPGTAFRREKLAGVLWPDASEANARTYLRNALWRVRQALTARQTDGRDYFLAENTTIAFDAAAPYQLDVDQLQARGEDTTVDSLMASVAVVRGELLPGFYDEWAVLERERLQAVFERKMGQLLDRLTESNRWPEVVEWGERWIALGGAPEPAYRALMAAFGEMSDTSRVAAIYARCVEALRDQLGVAPSEQTRVLFERLSRGEKDSQPAGASTSESVAAITAPAGAEAAAPGESPFKGLHYFEEADADHFFGRERLTAQLVQVLGEQNFLAVIGASGSGKSSLVRAGLIPAIKGLPPAPELGAGQAGAVWEVHLITPTTHPLEALAVSLTRQAESVTATATLLDDLARDPRSLHLYARKRAAQPPATRLLIVVDQFEELFTLCRSEEERLAFVGNLLTATGGDGLLSVVITLRADFYAHCAPYAGLRGALEQRQAYIGPMGADDLCRAIDAPARLGNWSLEPGLVDTLLKDVGEEPGALPLLSHALLETWKQRRGRTLTLAGYAATGGVRGAIAKTAQDVYDHLSAEQQTIARDIFLRLTELGENTQDTRRRAERAELVAAAGPGPAPSAVEGVLHILVDARLITTTETSLEVAHEALIREWPALRQWLSENREALLLHRRVTEAAQAWDRLKRDPGELYRGARLAQALEWAAWSQQSGQLKALEREFLEASRAAAEHETAEREAQRQRELEAAQKLAEAQRERAEAEERRAQSESQRAEDQTWSSARLRVRNRTLTVVGVVALILALAAGFFGFRANQSALSAQAQARLSLSRQLTLEAQGLLSTQYALAGLLSIEASRLDDSMDARLVLLNALQNFPPIPYTLVQQNRPATAVEFSHDGKLLATGDIDGVITLWDTTTRRPLGQPLAGIQSSINEMRFSPDDHALASGSLDGSVLLWDVPSRQLLGSLPFRQAGEYGFSLGTATTVSFSPDGGTLATGGPDYNVRLWNVATRQLIGQPLTGHTAPINDVSFSPDGHTVASTGNDHTIILWDVATQRPSGAPLDSGNTTNAPAVRFSRDGKLLASSTCDGEVMFWNTTTRHLVGQPLRGHTGCISDIEFSPDDSTLYSCGQDGTVRRWDVATLQAKGPPLTGHTAWVFFVAAGPDGKTVASASQDGKVILWDTAPRAPEGQPLSRPSAGVNSVAFGAGGKIVAAGYSDGQVLLWDTASRKVLGPPLAGHAAAVTTMAFSPDGQTLAAGSVDSTVVFWDVATRQTLSPTLIGNKYAVTSLAFAPDGKRLVTGGEDGMLRLADATTHQAIGPPLASQTRVTAVAFAPDGRTVAAGGLSTFIRLWNVATGQPIGAPLSQHTDSITGLSFSPDGKILASSSADGTLLLWDVASGHPIGLPFTGHQGPVLSVAISPDGLIMASGGQDRSVRLWNLATRQPLGQPLLGHTGSVASVAFSADGQMLASSSQDGTILLWDLSTTAWQTTACADAGRNLTLAEWQQYLPGQLYHKTCDQWPVGK